MNTSISHNVCSLRTLKEGDKFKLPSTDTVFVVVLGVESASEFPMVSARVIENPKFNLVSVLRMPLPGEQVLLMNQNVIPLE